MESSADICEKYLYLFKDILDEKGDLVKLPKEKITIFCEGKKSGIRGFLINITEEEAMGDIHFLIAKKYIIHNELEKIAGCKIKDK